MNVGDLVHAPRYPYWGMGVIIGKSSTEVQVYWFKNGTQSPAEGWHDKDYLEKL